MDTSWDYVKATTHVAAAWTMKAAGTVYARLQQKPNSSQQTSQAQSSSTKGIICYRGFQWVAWAVLGLVARRALSKLKRMKKNLLEINLETLEIWEGLSPLGQSIRRAINLRDLCQVIRYAATDRSVTGLVLHFTNGQTSLTWVQAEEIRAAIAAFRATTGDTKPTVAYADTVGEGLGVNVAYLVASSCQRVFMSPAGFVWMNGLRGTTVHVARLFGWVGLDPNLEAREEYKSAAEFLTREAMSDAAREQLDRLVAAYWRIFTGALAADGHVTAESLAGAAAAERQLAERSVVPRAAEELGFTSLDCDANGKGSEARPAGAGSTAGSTGGTVEPRGTAATEGAEVYPGHGTVTALGQRRKGPDGNAPTHEQLTEFVDRYAPMLASVAAASGLVELAWKDEVYNTILPILAGTAPIAPAPAPKGGQPAKGSGCCFDPNTIAKKLTAWWTRRPPTRYAGLFPYLKLVGGPEVTWRPQTWNPLLAMVQELTAPKVAVVVLHGNVHMGESKAWYEDSHGVSTSIGHASARRALRAATDASDVKAILLRIVSRGGSFTASACIQREVNRAVAYGKVVVVSMGDVAASGGYFIAMGAHRVFAARGTVTGSIGVIAGKVVVRGLLHDKLGVTTDTTTSEAPTAASFTSPLEPYSTAGRERVARLADVLYDQFRRVVSSERGLPAATVAQLAKGQVFDGAAAVRTGLVDGLGGWHEATECIRGLLGRPAGSPLRFVAYPRTGLMALLSATGRSSEDPQPTHALRMVTGISSMVAAPAVKSAVQSVVVGGAKAVLGEGAAAAATTLLGEGEQAAGPMATALQVDPDVAAGLSSL